MGTCSLKSRPALECRPSAGWLLLLIGLFSPGCGGRDLPPPADPDQARAALRSALEAWKKGERPESLRDHNPPTYVADHDWSQGYQLERFEVSPKDQMSGLNLRCTVNLFLRDAEGNTWESQVVYLIETGSSVSIIRKGL
jgi:hypothetical protein